MHIISSTHILYHLAIMAIIFFVPLILVKLKLNAINAMPEQKSRVKVVSKTIHRSSNVSGKVLIRSSKRYVIFEFPCGSIKQFRVKPELFNNFFENEIGYITYKEKNNNRLLIDFKKVNISLNDD